MVAGYGFYNIRDNLHAAADKMAIQHLRKLGEAKVGDTVQVELSKYDRGPLDCNYLLAYITEINEERSLYKQKLVKYDSLDFSKEFGLRGINDLESLSGGQGIVSCSCQGACKNCMCKQKNVPCNSKSHNGKQNLKCINKL
ncbi:unnamed protein product [Brachionus calyciflorus]|uniref:Uncharacterized protein n=1 Tax=Brachionus calyciflorus TaxID=104777 RepID=A0A814DKA0_9BILA|nr:unnamed protein product [Brachionus calyciflorus]